MQNKKVPIRTCIACKSSKPKKDMLRIVKSKTGDICIDRTSKQEGRGAYVCNDITCIEKAVKSKALNRAFECNVGLEVYDKLKGEFSENK
ncbi:MAG: YlxR family protein [Clostridia bacterium]